MKRSNPLRALIALLALGLQTAAPAIAGAQDAADQPLDFNKIKEGGKPPRPIKQEPPVYPYAMSRAGLIGTVMIEFIIDRQGSVPNAYVVESNNPWFERPAVDAVLGWKFEPGQIGGRPVATRARQLIVFQLDRGGQTPDIWQISKGKDHAKLPPEFRWDTPPIPTNTLYPVYPFEQLKAGTKGTVKITYIVGPEGRVVGAKLIEAASPELGQAVLAMIDAWQFQPARRKDGAATYANLSSEYDFRPNGWGDVPVGDTAFQILRDLEKKPEAIASLAELDKPLKPLSRRPPVYPTALRQAGQDGSALIEFFVDRNGDAQLPRIVSSTAPEFGYAAALAVATWRFEAPTRHGKPVVARARIPVDFTLRSKKPVPEK